jgi:hypothetical protein
MEACEVGIDITVEVQVAGGLDNHAHFAGAMQIANKSLDCGGMNFLWAVTEPGDLADGNCDVGASVGGEVKQHTDNGAVAPGFFHRWSVRVSSESGLSSWRPIKIAVGHASCILDLLNQTFLGEGQCAIRQILSDIDAQEVSKSTFASKVESFGFQVGEKLLEVVFISTVSNTWVVSVENNHDSVFVEYTGVVRASFETFFTKSFR